MAQILWSGKVVGTVFIRADHNNPKYMHSKLMFYLTLTDK